MNKKDLLITKGKQLAFLLRHDKKAFDNGLIDQNGWRNVSELVSDKGCSVDLIEEIVATNNISVVSYIFKPIFLSFLEITEIYHASQEFSADI